MTKLLDQEKKFSFKQTKRSKILKEMIEAAGLKAKIDVTGLKDDVIDYGVGFVLNKKVGDYVLENEELLKVYIKNKDVSIVDIINCFEISEHAKEKEKLIYEIVR